MRSRRGSLRSESRAESGGDWLADCRTPRSGHSTWSTSRRPGSGIRSRSAWTASRPGAEKARCVTLSTRAHRRRVPRRWRGRCSQGRSSAIESIEDGADRVVGQQGAQRNHQKEQDLLDRHPNRDVHAGDVCRVVRPQVGADSHLIPEYENGGDGQHSARGPPELTVDARAKDLQRQGDRQAGRQNDEVLPVIHYATPDLRPSDAAGCVNRARQERNRPAPATRSRRPLPTVARWLNTAKSQSSMQSRIPEYSVSAVATHGRDRGSSIATPSAA